MEMLVLYVALIIVAALACWSERRWLARERAESLLKKRHETERKEWAEKEAAIVEAFWVVWQAEHPGRERQELVVEWTPSHFIERITSLAGRLKYDVHTVLRIADEIRDRLAELYIHDAKVYELVEDIKAVDKSFDELCLNDAHRIANIRATLFKIGKRNPIIVTRHNPEEQPWTS